MQKWNYLYSLVGDNLSHDDAAEMAYWVAQDSELNNPYYFSGPFSGFVARKLTIPLFDAERY